MSAVVAVMILPAITRLSIRPHTRTQSLRSVFVPIAGKSANPGKIIWLIEHRNLSFAPPALGERGHGGLARAAFELLTLADAS
jgi:hypothetical protein